MSGIASFYVLITYSRPSCWPKILLSWLDSYYNSSHPKILHPKINSLAYTMLKRMAASVIGNSFTLFLKKLTQHYALIDIMAHYQLFCYYYYYYYFINYQNRTSTGTLEVVFHFILYGTLIKLEISDSMIFVFLQIKCYCYCFQSCKLQLLDVQNQADSLSCRCSNLVPVHLRRLPVESPIKITAIATYWQKNVRTLLYYLFEIRVISDIVHVGHMLAWTGYLIDFCSTFHPFCSHFHFITQFFHLGHHTSLTSCSDFRPITVILMVFRRKISGRFSEQPPSVTSLNVQHLLGGVILMPVLDRDSSLCWTDWRDLVFFPWLPDTFWALSKCVETYLGKYCTIGFMYRVSGAAWTTTQVHPRAYKKFYHFMMEK